MSINEINSKNNSLSKESTTPKLMVFLKKYPYLIIVSLTLLVYFQTFFFDYTNYDDQHFRFDNKLQTEKMNDFGAALLNPYLYSTYYRPVVNLTFYIDAQVAGESAFMHHFTNFLLHCIAASLLFALFRRLKYSSKLSLSLSLIFSIHPILTNATVWIVGRGDLLAAIFGLSSFLMFLKYIEKKDILSLLLHFVFLILAVFSKESLLLFPLVFAAYWLSVIRGRKIPNSSLLVMFWILPLILFPIIKSILNIDFTSGNFDLSNFFKNLPVIPEAVSKTIAPFDIDILPEYNLINTLLGIILIAFATVILIKNKKNILSGNLLFGLSLFIIPLIPSMLISGMYVEIGNSKQFYDYIDTRFYIPMIGILIIIADMLQSNILKFRTNISLILASALIITFSILNIIQSRNYKDPFSFGKSIAKGSASEAFAGMTPEMGIELLDEAMELAKNEQFEKALNNLDRIIKADSTNLDMFAIRGDVRMQARDYSGAIEDFTRVLGFRTDDYKVYFYRGTSRMALRFYRDAIADFNEVIKLKPDDTAPYYQRGNSYYELNYMRNAEADFTFVIEKNPKDYFAYSQRGLCRMQLQNFNGALEDFNNLIKLSPDFQNAYINRGLVYTKLNDIKLACEDFNTAKDKGSDRAPELIREYCDK